MVTAETIDSIPNDTLVTYVGMVSDMFNPEYYVSEYMDVSGVWQTTRYGDHSMDAGCGGDGDVGGDGARSGCVEQRFDERHPVLVVPVPGQSEWVGERAREAARASMVKFCGVEWADRKALGGGAVGKRRLGGDSMDIDAEGGGVGSGDGDGANPTEGGGSDVAVGATKKTVTFDVPGAKQEGTERGALISSRGIPAGSCVVHLYHADAIKLNDVVQVVGVISRVPELASGAMHGMEEEEALASKIPTSVAPRVHAISVRKLDVTGVSIAPSANSEPEVLMGGSATREGIVRFLASMLQGDLLAAEYVLMQLVSRVHRRPQGAVGLVGGHGQDMQAQLGMAALNITGVSGSEGKSEGSCVGNSSFAIQLGKALSLLMPSVVSLPLEIESLNRQPWYPTKVNDSTNHGAVLQLAAGTVLVLDETAMSAGQLNETGLKNLGAIQTMMQSQKLPYDFQFYQLEQPTDQPIIIASMGRTMLKGAGEIQVALAAARKIAQDGGRQGDVRYDGNIEEARRFLVKARSMAFSIPQELEKQIENDLTEARKKDAVNVTAETFHSWLNLARLLCLSHGETSLSLDRWRQVLSMEAERISRLAEKYMYQ